MEIIYIVTGATGFVGNNLVKKLSDAGETVYAFARSKDKAEKNLNGVNAEVFFGDVRDGNALDKMFIKRDVRYIVINAAAVVLIGGGKKELREMTDINIQGVKSVIECCLKHNARLVQVSSVHAIPELKKRALITEIQEFNPKKVRGAYAKTKAVSSALVMDAVKNRGLNAVIVHPSGITGPGDYGNSLLTQMVRDYTAGKIPAAVQGGYDFVDVRDVCDGILAAAKQAESGSCYLLTNRYVSVGEILTTLSGLTDGKKIKRTFPVWMAKFGLPFIFLHAKIKKIRPLYTGYSLYTLQSNSNFSHQKAAAELGFCPREFTQSLKDTVEFLNITDSRQN